MAYKSPSKQLTATPSLVESPFIIVTIGGYTFGDYSHRKRGALGTGVKYPNYMKEITIKKVNGRVNQYTIKMEYTITAGDDPNLLEKVFSRAQQDRKIIISYGDWCDPTNIYKEEEALITDVRSNVDFTGSKISYTVSAVGAQVQLKASVQNFPARTAKPSDVLKELFTSEAYGLSNLFPGMKNADISNFIAGTDKKVTIEAKSNTSVMDYANYLVQNMTNINETTRSKYYLYIDDDKKNKYGGTVLKVVEVSANAKYPTADTYEVTIGYPNDDMVLGFNIQTDNVWSILYDYAKELPSTTYNYSLSADGKIVAEKYVGITMSSMYKSTNANDIWWNNMTSFPITATLQIKGLTRPTILMSFVKINALFYGQKHISSGVYIITAQEDIINSNGYKTNLSLTRVYGDNDFESMPHGGVGGKF